MKKRQLPLRKKILFTGIMFLLPLVFVLTVLEVYVRVSRPMVDLKAITGRTIGSNPMAEWAILDAFSAYRPNQATTLAARL